MSNIRKIFGKGESTDFRKISQCFYNAWAILLGVSVSEMPKTQSVRWFFIFYVCYCFAVCMVFQAYFTTYLVEPGYGRGYETMNEIIDDISNGKLVYGYIEGVELLAPLFEYTDHLSPKHRTDCSDLVECAERAMFKADIVVFSGTMFSNFVALKNGVHDVDKFVCFFHELQFTAPTTTATHKGNPILPILDKHTRMWLEAGIADRFWSNLKHTYELQAEASFDDSDMYFVFSLNHMAPVFVVLICGYIISFIVFVYELGFNSWIKLLHKLGYKSI